MLWKGSLGLMGQKVALQHGKKDSPPSCLLPLRDKILTLII